MTALAELLTPEQAAAVAACAGGRAYLAVEGVPFDDLDSFIVENGLPTPTEPFEPPPEWVALAEAKCETCGADPVHTYEVDGEQRCPDCIDGRPRHQLTVECDRCKTLDQFAYDKGFDLPGRRGHLRRSLVAEGLISDRCCTDGHITVDGVVTEVLPVDLWIPDKRNRSWCPRSERLVYIDNDGPFIWDGETSWRDLDLSGGERGARVTRITPIGVLRPGWFVVVLNVEARP